ncbi:hypothetical protein AGMMS50268_07700 [Spirochaetia bacterium]|nr:hypothetical protein AGMMS50268_07700 [Spirochaetia bacterium]
MRTQEQKQTDKERKRAKRNGKPRKAVILEGKLFKNQKEAAEHFGVNVKTIKRRIKKDDVE